MHYVVLDDIDWINTGGKDGVLGNRDYNRVVSLAQMEWLAEDLAAVADKTAPLVICLHVQLHENYNASFANTVKMSSATGGTAALLNAVKEFSEVHFMTGHTHHNATMVINDRVIEHNTAAVCETWWWSSYFSDRAVCVDGSPAGYGIYTVNATDVKWSYKGIGEPAGYQFRTYDMNTVKKHLDNNVYKSYLKQYSSRRNDGDDYGTVGENVVYVNVWNYDPAWTVEVKENGVPLPVTRVFDRDRCTRSPSTSPAWRRNTRPTPTGRRAVRRTCSARPPRRPRRNSKSPSPIVSATSTPSGCSVRKPM